MNTMTSLIPNHVSAMLMDPLICFAMMALVNVTAKKTLSETNVPNVLLSILDSPIVKLACAMPMALSITLVMQLANVLAMITLLARNVTNVLMDLLNFQLVTNVLLTTMVSLNAKVILTIN